MTRHPENIGEHITAVLFDHDDTLVDTFKAKSAQHIHIARTHYDKDLSIEEVKEHWGKPLPSLLGLLYETDDIQKALAHSASYLKDYPKPLFEFTMSTLQRIKSTGRKIGLVTATTTFGLSHDFALHGIADDLFDYTQTADDTEYHKPDPRVFEPAIEWLNTQQITPGQVLYVGDGLHDYRAAIGAGFNFIGVETGLVSADGFRQAGATSVPTIEHLA